MDEKICIACGMPMRTESDFACSDESKDYCKYCSLPNGEMQSFEEKVVSMTNFVVRTQGIDEEVARATVIENLKKLPAWRG